MKLSVQGNYTCILKARFKKYIKKLIISIIEIVALWLKALVLSVSKDVMDFIS